jgi:hypothetical protein
MELERNKYKRNILNVVGFEVLTVVVMKSTIFWDITLCNPLSVNRRFGGTSFDNQRTTRRYIPEHSTLQTKLCDMELEELRGKTEVKRDSRNTSRIHRRM